MGILIFYIKHLLGFKDNFYITLDSRPEFLTYKTKTYTLKLFIQWENVYDIVISINEFDEKTKVLKLSNSETETIKMRINRYLRRNEYNSIWYDFSSPEHKKMIKELLTTI